MKAYKIQDDLIAANSEQEAITEWAKHFDVEPDTSGPVEELNPETFQINYEQGDGSYKPGPLSHLIPDGDDPIVLIDGEVEP